MYVCSCGRLVLISRALFGSTMFGICLILFLFYFPFFNFCRDRGVEQWNVSDCGLMIAGLPLPWTRPGLRGK